MFFDSEIKEYVLFTDNSDNIINKNDFNNNNINENYHLNNTSDNSGNKPQQQEPKDLQNLLETFDNYRSIKNYKKANECIKKCIKIYPNYYYLYYKQSFLFKSLKTKPIETIRSCQRAYFEAKRQKNKFWKNMLKGFYFELLGGDILNLKKSCKIYEIAERFKNKRTLHSSDLYFRLGMTYGDLQNFEKAIDYFLKAFDLQKKQDDCKLYYLGMCYNNIGWCYKHLNNEEKACEYYSKAIEVSGGNVVLFYTNRIKSLKALNKYKEAIDDCNISLTLTQDPQTMCEILCELGFLHHLKGDRELACCTFKSNRYYKAFFFPYLYLGNEKFIKNIYTIKFRNNNQFLYFQ
ncbi:hypothetical protein ABK040_010731 [Willaertia magna]